MAPPQPRGHTRAQTTLKEAGRASRENEAGAQHGVLPQGQVGAASTQQREEGTGADAAGRSCGQQTVTRPGPKEQSSFLKINLILTKLNVPLPFSPAGEFPGVYPKA